MSHPFDLMGHSLQRGFTLVEASAGTGKTYSITWLVTRLILERELEADDLLVVTFTIAATEELDSRIRAQLTDVLGRWPQGETRDSGDHGEDPRSPEEISAELGGELGALYLSLSPLQRAQAPARLQRALERFDLAQISTIHGFCGQLLRDFPLESGIEATQVQTHLTPLFEEVIEDFRSTILSSASYDALRLMTALAKGLKHQPEHLMKLCNHLEAGGWGEVTCDPLLLPSAPQVPAPHRLKALARASQTSLLPPPPPVFPEEGERGVNQLSTSSEAPLEVISSSPVDTSPKESTSAPWDASPETSSTPSQEDSSSPEGSPHTPNDASPRHERGDELFSPEEMSLPFADLTPSDVIAAWDHIGSLFDYTLGLRLIPALRNETWRAELAQRLDQMNERAQWRSGGGAPSQALGWDAIDQLLEVLERDQPITGAVVALYQDLSRLATSQLRAQLDKRKKKVNADFLEFSHPLSDTLDTLVELMGEVTETLRGWFRWGFACYAQRELPRRKELEGWMSTNDLVRFTYAALQRPDGQLLAQARLRFKAALIDEFQDTDPMQWGIFEPILNPEESEAITYLIGDPKQSIYRFRGADLNAYLAVKLRVDPERRYTMSRNFRSDPRLLNALNQHFDPRAERLIPDYWSEVPAGSESEGEGFFCDEQVPYVHVDGGRPNRLAGYPALRWRYFDFELGLTTRGEPLAEYVAEDVCQYLLAGHEIGPPHKLRPVRLGDIGVLTRTNHFAQQIAEALARRGIASTIRSDESVFKTTAAAQLERLMRAALMPEDEGALRAALAVSLLAFDARDVRERADELKQVFITLHQIWLSQGFSASIHALLHHPELRLVIRALRQADGARDLSRLMHAAERAQARVSALGLTPELTLQWLRERRLEVDVEVEEEDAVRPHIDTDAVQVVTVHRSKGLEYPILFCPDLWIVKSFRGGEVRVTEPETPGDLRSLDLRLNKSPEQAVIDAKLREAERREERRLIYVALTRAAHHCSLYLSVGKTGFANGALYPMVMGLTPLLSGKPKREDLARAVTAVGDQRFLEARGEVLFEVESRAPKVTAWGGGGLKEPPLAVHTTPNPTRPAWQIASFTSLSQVALSQAEERLTLEELPELDERSESKVVAPIQYRGAPPPLLELSGSARFGQCLHALLERLDFRQQLSEVERLTEALLRAWGFDLHLTGRVARGIWTALQTPLASPEPNPNLGRDEREAWLEHNLRDFRLCDLSPDMRRDEVQFELPLADKSPLSGDLLNRILRLDPACHELPTFPDDFQLQGFLKGSIDLMFRLSRNGVTRYYLVDYKSHWLGDETGSQLGHYHPEALKEIMNSHLYHVQSHLYQVVLYRLLRDRLGASYQHQRQFGGALYLFLRGMAGGESRILTADRDQGAAGVYAHRPPRRVTELLSLALEDPQEAEQALNGMLGGARARLTGGQR